MMPSFQTLMEMVWRSITSPREGAAEVLALGLPMSAIWLSMALVSIISAMLTQLADLFNTSGEPAFAMLFNAPFAFVLVQFVSLVGFSAALNWIGRAMGGTGRFPEAAILMVWLQFILICVQVAQIVALLIMPFFGALIFLGSLCLALWLLVNFVAVLHGIQSLLHALVMSVASTFALGFVLFILLGILGIGVMPVAEV